MPTKAQKTHHACPSTRHGFTASQLHGFIASPLHRFTCPSVSVSVRVQKGARPQYPDSLTQYHPIRMCSEPAGTHDMLANVSLSFRILTYRRALSYKLVRARAPPRAPRARELEGYRCTGTRFSDTGICRERGYLNVQRAALTCIEFSDIRNAHDFLLKL